MLEFSFINHSHHYSVITVCSNYDSYLHRNTIIGIVAFYIYVITLVIITVITRFIMAISYGAYKYLHML